MSRTFLYRKNESKIFDLAEVSLEDLEADGWKDSPAYFDNDAPEEVKPEGPFDLNTADKKALRAYALKHFDVKFDKNITVEKLRVEVQNLIENA